MTSVSKQTTRHSRAATIWLTIGWITALVATLSAVFIGEVMGRTPCVLCWYQRIFMFPLALVLGVASYRGDHDGWRYAMPLAVIGAGFAGYHTLLYWGVIEPEIVSCSAETSCSGAEMAILGSIPLPFVSLLAFALIVISLFLVRHHTNK